MLNALKSLLVVLSVAWLVFALAKPICLRFMAEVDFVRRRNVWFLLTAAGLISPNIWLFALVAAPLLIWSGRKDSNSVALYLLLMHVVPPVGKQIPAVLVNQLFELNSYRILAIVLLAPAAWRLMAAKSETKPAGLAAIDGLVLGYLGLVIVLGIPYESITNTMRRLFLSGIDVILLYYVVSRTCISRRSIREALASVVLACAISAPLALVEASSTSLLFRSISTRWETVSEIDMLMRGEALRAQVSAGHALALAYMMSIGFCCWLSLRSQLVSKWIGFGVGALMWMGLVATLSRGPALAAILGYFAFMTLGRQGSSRLVKALFVSALLASALYFSPVWDDLMELLPFVGTVDAENVVYRQRLAAISWVLIQENPILGDPFFLSNMEELRQGQGIIDLVNVYAAVALQSGGVGLFLLLGSFTIGLWRTFKLVRLSAVSDPELADIGAGLIACMVSTLFVMAAASFYLGVAKMYYVLVGVAAGYASLAGALRQSPPANSVTTAASYEANPRRWKRNPDASSLHHQSGT